MPQIAAPTETSDPDTGEVIDESEAEQQATDAGAVETEVIDDTSFFERLEENLAVASDLATVEEIWTEADPLARFEGKPNGEVNQAIALQIRKRAEKRIGGA
jgi:hypothetical protein